MIDSLSPDQTETQLLPGFQKLGLDPAQVKIIVVGHGHARSLRRRALFSGPLRLQDLHGRGGLGHPRQAAVWKGASCFTLPKRDQVLVEGQPVVLGDLKVTPVAVPGHTPGSMGFIFPVKDKGKKYMAAMYAGTVLTPGIVSDEGLADLPEVRSPFQGGDRRKRRSRSNFKTIR